VRAAGVLRQKTGRKEVQTSTLEKSSKGGKRNLTNYVQQGKGGQGRRGGERRCMSVASMARICFERWDSPAMKGELSLEGRGCLKVQRVNQLNQLDWA